MKDYDSYFRRCQNPAYDCNQYINYSLHKEKLRQFYQRRRQLSKIIREGNGLTAHAFAQLTGGSSISGSDHNNITADAPSYLGSYFRYDDTEQHTYVDEEDAILRLSIIERKEFGTLLEEQISTAAIYYTNTLLPQVQTLLSNKQYNEAAMQLLEVMAFACTNIITFRQLLIRYDAFCRSYEGMPLNEWHLQRSVLDVDHPVHDFFVLEGSSTLKDMIAVGIGKQQNTHNNEDQDGNEQVLTVDDFTAQVQSFIYLLEKTDNSLNKAVAGHVVFKDRLLALGMRLKQYMLFGIQSRKFLNFW